MHSYECFLVKLLINPFISHFCTVDVVVHFYSDTWHAHTSNSLRHYCVCK